SPSSEEFPERSPDGARIIFASDRTGNEDLFVMNSDGSGIQQFTFGASDDWPGTWSLDASRIAFASNAPGNNDIITMNSDCTGVQQVTTNYADDWLPDW